MPKRVAPRHLHATGLEHEHARSDFSGHEQRLFLAVAPHLAEAAEPIDFRWPEFWEHSFVARIDLGMARPRAFNLNPIRRSAESARGQRLLARGRRKGTVQFGQIGRRKTNIERRAVLPNMSGLARLRIAQTLGLRSTQASAACAGVAWCRAATNPTDGWPNSCPCSIGE